jgi:hypothetical protein
MSLIKKAHSLLLQSRAETNPRKASILRKASIDTYNEMIAFSFIYGVVTGDSDYASTTSKMNLGNDFTQTVADLIRTHHNLPTERSLSTRGRNDIAHRLATEFFDTKKLSEQNFYNVMLKGFSFSLKSRDLAEDAIHNVLSGRNPVTDSEYTRAEERNQFAFAGKKHSTLKSAFLSTLASLTVDRNAPIESHFGLTKASILTTIGLLKERLKNYSGGSHGLNVSQIEDIQQRRNQQSDMDRSVEDYLPPSEDMPSEDLFSVFTESSIDKLIELFQKGYGWKYENSKTNRRAIAFFFLCMKVNFEASIFNELVELDKERDGEEDQEVLLNKMALTPKHINDVGVVIIGNEIFKIQNEIIQMVNKKDTEFLDELKLLYEEINPLDEITQSAGLRAFQTAWTTFLGEIGQDIMALKKDLPLPINPSAKSTLESASLIFKQGSQKRKASLKARLASLLRRYNQI